MGAEGSKTAQAGQTIPETVVDRLAEEIRPHVTHGGPDGRERSLPGITSVVLEGGEGCGKGTMQQALVRTLRKAGLDALGIREPGGSPMGEQIREMLLEDAGATIEPMAKAMLFAASRAQLIRDVIRPAVGQGRLLVFDRFVQSSYVYQGIVDGIGLQRVMDINAMALDGFSPSVSLFLDVPPETGISRITSAHGSREVNWLDREPLPWHEMVHGGYMRLVGDGLLTRIDANQPPEFVLEQCVRAVLEKTVP